MGRAILGTVVALAIALAGCGGDDEADAPAQPKLPAELADALAYESDQIAASLAEGRECAAHRQAQALRAHVGDAVGSGKVPPSLGREMSAAATSLDDGIVCEPPPPPEPEPEPAPTACEQLEAQLDQLKAQAEQLKQGGPGSEEMKKQLEEQAKQVEDQLRFQCEELEGGGSEEGFVPPGQQDGGPGNGRGGGDD